MSELVDVRPEIEPDHFSFRELPADGDIQSVTQDACEEMWKRGVEEIRATIVSDEYPREPYPHGLYFEGWSTAPHRQILR